MSAIISNKSLAAFIVNDGVRAIKGKYDPNESTSYMWKTMDPDVKVGDIVVVPTDKNRVGFTTNVVVEVDVEPDYSSSINYKWIAGVCRKEDYDIILKREDEMISKLNKLEQRKARDELKAQMEKMMGDDMKHLSLDAAPPTTTETKGE